MSNTWGVSRWRTKPLVKCPVDIIGSKAPLSLTVRARFTHMAFQYTTTRHQFPTYILLCSLIQAIGRRLLIRTRRQSTCPRLISMIHRKRRCGNFCLNTALYSRTISLRSGSQMSLRMSSMWATLAPCITTPIGSHRHVRESLRKKFRPY